MALRLYNTLTRTQGPIETSVVRMYHCGPTVYDFAHIGNLRTFIVNDILRRTLEYTGYEVKQVMNITDVDDKMIARAHERGVNIKALGEEYTNYLLADFKSLNILTPHIMPHATAHVEGMIAMIEKLLRDEYAYIASDGVYFEVAKSKDYGALAHLDLSAETESRVLSVEDKKSSRDFALWKFEDADDHGTAYDASFGRGRPGWHIECSEMSRVTLGETLDIHTGGVDLIFPHHTNEIAQSEAVSCKQFVKTWLHTEFVMIDGQKMSKSLDNHTTLQTVIERGFSPLAFRYFVLGSSYRSKLNFTWEALEGAQTALLRMRAHLSSQVGTVHNDYKERFLEIITNDLDTSRALALVWEVAKDTTISERDRNATLLDFDKVLGLGLTLQKNEVIPENIQTLIGQRDEARKNKDWSKSDEIRDEINKLGYEIVDTENGSEIRKK